MDPKKRALSELRAISYFSSSLHLKDSIEEVLWDITKNVIHQFDFVDCVIYVYRPETNILVQEAAYGPKNPWKEFIFKPMELRLGQGIVGHVAAHRKAEIVHDTSKDERYVVDDEFRYSKLCVPILINNTLFGVIDSEHPKKNFYSKKHQYLLNIVAGLCAQKIKELKAQQKPSYTRDNPSFRKLENLITHDKIYRDPNLSLNSVAQKLGISAGYLSAMINRIAGKSFVDYITDFRLKEAKKLLLSEMFSQYTVISIGLEAGFNSRSTFYAAFKKSTGITPSSFRKERFKVLTS